MSERKLPAGRPSTIQTSSSSEVDAFLSVAREVVRPAGGEGRLVLALDATMSRQPTWDLATKLQGDMFDAVGRSGNLSVQLAYFRGMGESRTSKFVSDTDTLKQLMQKIACRGGQTQIGRILSHAVSETRKRRVSAVVYIGDAMEENVDLLAQRAGELALAGTPLFLFQEGHDAGVEVAFRELARISKGAWFRFDQASAARLAELLKSIAVFSTGGFKALEARGSASDRMLIEHLRGTAR